MTVKDIPKWLVLRGISHILMGSMSSGTWNWTACDTMTNAGVIRKHPKRKCQRCMARLADLKLKEKL